MSGYCATGITNSDRNPAIVVTRAMTIASRGRSTKTADSIGLPLQIGLCRTGLHRHAGAQSLQALDDDLIAGVEALADDDVFAVGAAGLDPPDRDLAVIDHEN